MQRLFGSSKPKEKQPTLDDAINRADEQGARIQKRIDSYNAELSKYKKQLSGMREGPAKNSVKQRATRVLQQRKMYEQQLDQIEQQRYNIESTRFTSESLQNTLVTIKTMETTNKMLKKQYKNVDIDKLYDLQDEMSSIIEETNEIQQIMGQSYQIPDSVNEEDLDAELEALESEWNAGQQEGNELPSYLNFNNELPS
ncbi:hypothetical protein BB560_002783, partial [Smittium megazygosporum]